MTISPSKLLTRMPRRFVGFLEAFFFVCVCVFNVSGSQPDDWDDESDGEWEAPMIDNPDFKGEWKQRKIPNPAYKGVWKPRRIPNPDYSEVNFSIFLVEFLLAVFASSQDSNLYKYPSFAHVGIEVWNVNGGFFQFFILRSFCNKAPYRRNSLRQHYYHRRH